MNQCINQVDYNSLITRRFCFKISPLIQLPYTFNLSTSEKNICTIFYPLKNSHKAPPHKFHKRKTAWVQHPLILSMWHHHSHPIETQSWKVKLLWFTISKSAYSTAVQSLSCAFLEKLHFRNIIFKDILFHLCKTGKIYKFIEACMCS